jgi:CheY-like chemotaxis protein
MRVLIAEDDALLRMGYEDLISDLGHTVLTAVDGQDALDVLRAQAVDLLMTDLGMPRMDGCELLRRVTIEFPRLVCIVASAFTRETVAPELDGLGWRAVGFLRKPFTFDVLEHLVVEAERRLGLGGAA